MPGDPKSGVLPRISAAPPGEYGEGDKQSAGLLLPHVPDRSSRTTASRFRSPRATTRSSTSCSLRIFEAGWRETFEKFDPIPNRKTDTNNHGPFSTDNIGTNYDYPEASYERRREIIKEHETYQKGWLYFIANDPRVPEDVQERDADVGPGEGRVQGQRPLAAPDLRARGAAHDRQVRDDRERAAARSGRRRIRSAWARYGIDSHNVQRYITPEGYVQNEGDIGVAHQRPVRDRLRLARAEAGPGDNLLVPVCVSSSHIAFGSIRMEPVFMILGQSAATAAALAIDGGIAVQDVPYEKLRERLLADGQVSSIRRRPGGK